jgi:hypothetical protein
VEDRVRLLQEGSLVFQGPDLVDWAPPIELAAALAWVVRDETAVPRPVQDGPQDLPGVVGLPGRAACDLIAPFQEHITRALIGQRLERKVSELALIGPLCMAGHFGPQLSARLRSSAALSGAPASRSVFWAFSMETVAA